MTKKKVLLIFFSILILIQFIKIDKTNPPLQLEKDFIKIEKPNNLVTALFKNACYDCHSNETQYPWYSDIAPISFFLKSHIKGGRQKLNFSVWKDYPADKRRHMLEEIIEVIEEKRMPMKSYTWMHPKGKLTKSDKKLIIDWVQSVVLRNEK